MTPTEIVIVVVYLVVGGAWASLFHYIGSVWLEEQGYINDPHPMWFPAIVLLWPIFVLFVLVLHKDVTDA